MRSVSTVLAIASVALAFWIGAPAQAVPGDLGKASRFTTKGNRALKAGDADKARENYEKALDASAAFPDAHLGLGMIAMHAGNFDDALQHYEAARDAYADYGDAMLEIETKRFSEAQKNILELQDSITALSSSTGAQVARQIAQLQNRIAMLQAIQPPQPGESDGPPGEVYFYIGNALFQLQRIEEATDAWETCREKSPEFPMVYNNLALAYWQGGRLDEAETSLKKAEELGFPVNPQFKTDLAAAAEATQ